MEAASGMVSHCKTTSTYLFQVPRVWKGMLVLTAQDPRCPLPQRRALQRWARGGRGSALPTLLFLAALSRCSPARWLMAANRACSRDGAVFGMRLLSSVLLTLSSSELRTRLPAPDAFMKDSFHVGHFKVWGCKRHTDRATA